MFEAEDQASGTVLVLDDERNIVTVLKAILEKRNFQVEGFTDPREALNALRARKFDAVITDLYMPDIDGMAFLEEAKRLYPGLPVIMITAFGTVDSAVDAIKRGAFDYVTKPFEQSELVSVVQKAVNTSNLKKFSVARSDSSALPPQEVAFSALLDGKSPGIKPLRAMVKKVAATPSTVLILGETGCGKEFLAEEIHQLSDRSFQPLFKLNCLAISSMALDGEIFGAQKPGRLELADQGTLFLDEISEMSAETQQKLLEFLDGGKFENVITGEKRSADVRIIAASRKDLAKEAKEGRFREDLFYKLNVVPVFLPPLRERKEDLPEIVDFFLARLNRKLNRTVEGLDPACMDIFRSVSWPGNFRQLEHVLERMILLSEANLLVKGDIPSDLRSEIDLSAPTESGSFREIVRRQTQSLEKDLIEKALDEMDGNITRTAEHLGISRKGLQIKMKELGIKQGSAF